MMKTIGQDFFKIFFIFFVKSNHSSPKGSVRSKNKLLHPEQEVNDMTQAHRRTADTNTEAIEVLVAISQVSARMAKNLSVLAARQSEEGGKYHEQNERNSYDHRRAAPTPRRRWRRIQRVPQ